MTASWHPETAALDAFVAGAPAGSELAAHLARCAACRRTVAARDASALFGLLAGLPAPAAPAWPGIDAVLAAAGEPAGRATPAPSRWRAALASAAMLAAAALALLVTLRSPVPSQVAAPQVASRASAATGLARPVHAAATEAVVGRVDSPTAQILTLVPPGGEGPSVTLILDEGFDL